MLVKEATGIGTYVFNVGYGHTYRKPNGARFTNMD